MQTQKRKELRVRNKCTCHVYGQIHQYRIQIETEEIKLDAQSSKTKLQKIQRWQRVEKQKTLKLKTQVFQLKQPHKKPGFPLTIGRIEHGTLEHPSARRAPYYPICYTCSWHSPPLLVSVATSCLNREGLEPKLRCHYSHYTLHAGPLLLVFSTVKGVHNCRTKRSPSVTHAVNTAPATKICTKRCHFSHRDCQKYCTCQANQTRRGDSKS